MGEEEDLVDLTNEISACRACLVTDTKLYILEENGLMEAFEDIVGNPIFESDEMPQYLCGPCRAHVLKFVTFRQRCQRVQDLLDDAMCQGDEITMEYIKKIDRIKHRLDNSLSVCSTLIIDTLAQLMMTSDEQQPSIDNGDKFEPVLIQNIIPVKGDTSKMVDNEVTDEVTGAVFDDMPFSPLSDNYFPEDDVKENEATTTVTNEFVPEMPSEMQQRKEIERKKRKRAQSRLRRKKKSKTLEEIEEFCKNNGLAMIKLDFEQQQEALSKVMRENALKYKCVCHYCGAGRKDLATLEMHLQKTHDPTAEYSCDVCQARFDDKDDFNKHVDKHAYRYRCGLCTRFFSPFSEARNHINDKHNPNRKCKYCQKPIQAATMLREHVRNEHPETLDMCIYCGQNYKKYTNGASTHVRKKHPEIFNSTHICTTCNSKFVSSEALSRHKSDEAACGERACAQCGVGLASEGLLRLHLLEHFYRGPDLSQYKCTKCSTEFLNPEALTKHEQLDLCTEYYWCCACGASCITRELLAEHAREVHTEKKFACRICGMKYGCLNLFKTHYAACRNKDTNGERKSRRTTVGTRLWEVDSSGQLVMRYQVPRAKVSTDDPMEMCEICGKMAKTRTMKFHRNGHSQKFKCDHCGKGFPDKTRLTEHLAMHTGEKPYKCTLCDSRFKKKSTVKKHMSIHLGTREHVCNICGKPFRTSTCVRAHIRGVHLGQRMARPLRAPPGPRGRPRGQKEPTSRRHSTSRRRKVMLESEQDTTPEVEMELLYEQPQQEYEELNVIQQEEYLEVPEEPPPTKKKKIKSDEEFYMMGIQYDQGNDEQNSIENAPSFDEVVRTYNERLVKRKGLNERKIKVKRVEVGGKKEMTQDFGDNRGERRFYGKKRPRHTDSYNPTSHDETMGAIERINIIKNSFDTSDYTEFAQNDYSNGIPEDYGEPSTIPTSYGGKYPTSGKGMPVYEEDEERFKRGGKYPPSGKRVVVIPRRGGYGGKGGKGKYVFVNMPALD